MKNINRFTEPENLIEQSGSLKLKWAAVIAVIGIVLLWLLAMYPFFKMYTAAKKINIEQLTK